jgi:phenylacetate-CoA ligase
MGRFARLHAWMTCQFAGLDVPAYKSHLAANEFSFRWFDLTSYPPTSKDSYVKKFSEEQRCWDGHLDRSALSSTRSSGSSGTPFNWVRGKRELNVIHRNVAGFATQVFPRQRLFVINAYSMGAWATGTNTGIAMAKIAMVRTPAPTSTRSSTRSSTSGRTTTISSPPTHPSSRTCDRLDARGSTGTRTRCMASSAARG